jgi:hypothetical protein
MRLPVLDKDKGEEERVPPEGFGCLSLIEGQTRIHHETPPLYFPQANSVTEQIHRTIIEGLIAPQTQNMSTRTDLPHQTASGTHPAIAACGYQFLTKTKAANLYGWTCFGSGAVVLTPTPSPTVVQSLIKAVPDKDKGEEERVPPEGFGCLSLIEQCNQALDDGPVDLRSNDGGDYTSQKFGGFLAKHGSITKRHRCTFRTR